MVTKPTIKHWVQWVWSQDELPKIGSGRRRVIVTDHPRRPKYVKVYPLHDPDKYPQVISRAVLESITTDGD